MSIIDLYMISFEIYYVLTWMFLYLLIYIFKKNIPIFAIYVACTVSGEARRKHIKQILFKQKMKSFNKLYLSSGWNGEVKRRKE